MQVLIADVRAQWLDLDRRIAGFEAEFVAFAKQDEDTRRLVTIPGIGVLNATALTAAIGKGQAFEHGRDLSAWLGLVPRRATTGGKSMLLGITKRGNKYLRKLLIHGARAALPHIAERDTGSWPMGKRIARAGPSECCCRRLGQQARPDRLGSAAAR
jgi:transposase